MLGVSGGADSVALFHILMMLKDVYQLQLIVVHVNHGMRKEAGQDASYVEQLCNSSGIPFYLFWENIPFLAKSSGKSEEEMGRIYRYQCFRDIVKKEAADKIVVAHHENDQAETVLFHMLRGTDLRGLTGMEPFSMGEEGIPIIRPLLCVNRDEIETYLKHLGIKWCEDITNQNNDYARNALRNVVIPAMEEMNSGAVSHISRLAAQMKEYGDYFDDRIKEYITQRIEHSQTSELLINRNDLLKEPPVFVRGVLYELLSMVSQKKKDLSYEHIDALYDLLSKQSGKSMDLPYGVTASLMYENLVLGQSLDKDMSKPSPGEGIIYLNHITWKENEIYETCISGFGQIRIACKNLASLNEKEKKIFRSMSGNVKNHYTKYFDCDKIIATLCLRTHMAGDFLCINDNGNVKKVSRYFKDEKIPVNLRNRIPLLALGHEILDIAGYRRCERYKVTEATNKVLVVTYEGEENGSD